MGSFINPLFAAFVPGGMNPTGNQLTLSNISRSATGANAFLPETSLSPNVATTGPLGVVPGAQPAFPANVGPFPSTTTLAGPGGAGGPFGQPGAPFGFTDWHNLYKDLKHTYGKGMAELIINFLQSGAGFNQQTINNLLATLQPGIERGTESIAEQFSAMGTRFGSPAATGLGDFLSRVQLNEGQIVSQMYEDALNRFLDVLTGTSKDVASARASSPSGLDSILGILGLGGQAAGGASAAISAISPAADTSILDAIAGALAFA